MSMAAGDEGDVASATRMKKAVFDEVRWRVDDVTRQLAGLERVTWDWKIAMDASAAAALTGVRASLVWLHELPRMSDDDKPDPHASAIEKQLASLLASRNWTVRSKIRVALTHEILSYLSNAEKQVVATSHAVVMTMAGRLGSSDTMAVKAEREDDIVGDRDHDGPHFVAPMKSHDSLALDMRGEDDGRADPAPLLLPFLESASLAPLPI
jgi:hypothetical protein